MEKVEFQAAWIRLIQMRFVIENMCLYFYRFKEDTEKKQEIQSRNTSVSRIILYVTRLKMAAKSQTKLRVIRGTLDLYSKAIRPKIFKKSKKVLAKFFKSIHKANKLKNSIVALVSKNRMKTELIKNHFKVRNKTRDFFVTKFQKNLQIILDNPDHKHFKAVNAVKTELETNVDNFFRVLFNIQLREFLITQVANVLENQKSKKSHMSMTTVRTISDPNRGLTTRRDIPTSSVENEASIVPERFATETSEEPSKLNNPTSQALPTDLNNPSRGPLHSSQAPQGPSKALKIPSLVAQSALSLQSLKSIKSTSFDPTLSFSYIRNFPGLQASIQVLPYSRPIQRVLKDYRESQNRGIEEPGEVDTIIRKEREEAQHKINTGSKIKKGGLKLGDLGKRQEERKRMEEERAQIEQLKSLSAFKVVDKGFKLTQRFHMWVSDRFMEWFVGEMAYEMAV